MICLVLLFSSRVRMLRSLLCAISAALLTPAQAASFVIDGAHTSAHFAASHFDRTLVRGRILQITGSIDFDAPNRSGKAEISMEVDSLDTGLRLLDNVLKSPQFFDVAEFPQIRFSSTGFEFDGERLVAVNGLLTLHGITLPVQLQARRFSCSEIKVMVLRRQVCGGDFQTTILRSEFGMQRFLPDVSDRVSIEIAIEATPAN